MLFNTSKCKDMHIGKSQKKYPYYMNNEQLEEVTQEIDLGILISDLKVSQQCQSACTKAMRILGIINRTIVFSIQILCYVSISHWSDLILNTVQQRGPLTTVKTMN